MSEPLPSPVAVHEAGHCLVSLLLGDGVAHVEIDPERGSGLATTAPRPGRMTPARRLRLATVSVAGCLAEKMVFGGDYFPASSGDLEYCDKLFWGLAGPARMGIEARAERAAERLLRKNRAALLRLARELDRRGFMTGDEVGRLVAGG